MMRATIILAVLLLAANLPAEDPPAISILDLQCGEGVSPTDGILLTDRLLIELGRTGKYTIVNRSARDERLEQMGYEMSGMCDQATCVAEVGKEIGVVYMVYGSVGRIGQTWTVQAQMVDVATAKSVSLVARDNRGGAIDDLLLMMREVAAEFAGLETPSTPGATLSPSVSSSGQIAFMSLRDGNFEIYVMNADGTNQRRLTSNSAGDESPSWSPDGRQIAFQSLRDGYFEIFVMDASGANQRRLTSNSASDGSPSWSPDGRQIVFESYRDGNKEIYVMDASGANQRRLTSNSASDRFPSWSPDGRQIAFRSERDGDLEIYVMNSDGANQRRLTSNSAWDMAPSWSPDGRQIAFYSDRDGNYEIYVMDASGANQRRLTSNSALDAAPSWSPDGRQIAFMSDRDDWCLSWSPDGRQIAFYSDRDGNGEIYVMDASGANQRNLTNNPADDRFPRWSWR